MCLIAKITYDGRSWDKGTILEMVENLISALEEELKIYSENDGGAVKLVASASPATMMVGAHIIVQVALLDFNLKVNHQQVAEFSKRRITSFLSTAYDNVCVTCGGGTCAVA